MTTSDTIGRVPRPRGVLSKELANSLAGLKKEADQAHDFYKAEVVYALSQSSFSAVAEATGLSKDTLQRWKREVGE